jgi:hypothetical protein
MMVRFHPVLPTNINMNNKVKLKLTPEQVAVIYAFLHNTRLGSRNKFEDAISDLMIDMQEDGIEDYLDEFVPDMPKINIEFNNDEGMVFNIADGR